MISSFLFKLGAAWTLTCVALFAVGGMQSFDDWMNLAFVWLPAAAASLVSWITAGSK